MSKRLFDCHGEARETFGNQERPSSFSQFWYVVMLHPRRWQGQFYAYGQQLNAVSGVYYALHANARLLVDTTLLSSTKPQLISRVTLLS